MLEERLSEKFQIRHRTQPRTVSQLIEALDADLSSGRATELIPLETGFIPLDAVLGGGLRGGELTLLAGSPGVGKTIMALQWARHLAKTGTPVVYICYEHEESELLLRLLALEMGGEGTPTPLPVEDLRLEIQKAARNSQSFTDLIASNPTAREAFDRISVYADNLRVLKGSGAHTGVEAIKEIVEGLDGPGPVFVDYLQKVAADQPDEATRVTRIAEDLKDLALTYRIPFVSVVAAEEEGLRARRLRLHHIRGSSALAFEADIVLVLNDKFNCVSKVHLAYDPVRAESFKDYVILSIEKNRGGPSPVDLEFRKDFMHFRIEPRGEIVTDKLIDERIYVE